ncbi:MAG TPA: 50S ribosomal protein L15 [Rhodothermales bacterium]|nr:50S ribosomal protein L15 [Rhodothermales bacterium]
MKLSSLTYTPGARRPRKRIGRGQGSGYGGTSTKGHKGQKSRAGASIPAWFEGGQMPLTRRIPKFGFKNRNRVAYAPVNLARLTRLVEAGKIDPKEDVTPEVLLSAGVISKNDLVKVLGVGDVSVALKIRVHAVSASARQKIEAAGGSVA